MLYMKILVVINNPEHNQRRTECSNLTKAR